MPRLPVDGKKVKEFRITLGSFERTLLQELATSLRIASFSPSTILETLEDPTKIIQIAYSVATILEIFGFETGLPTAGDLPEVLEWFTKRGLKQDQAVSESNPTPFQVLKDLLTGELGGYPGGY